MAVGRYIAAVVLIGALAPSVVSAQDRASISAMNLSDRYSERPPRAVRADMRQPQWLVAPSPQWPDAADDISEPVTVTSECSVSRSGRMRDCRITGESLPDRGFGQAFLHALATARVGTNAYPGGAVVFRTTATFDPPASDRRPGL